MNSLRSSFAAVAACGLLFSATVSAFAAPKDYQITGTVSTLTDSTMTLVTNQKQNWDFARDTSTKLPDGVKPGDKVTVHYTMTAGTVDAKATDAPKGGKKADKAPKKAKADTAATVPAASGSPSKPAAEAASPTP